MASNENNSQEPSISPFSDWSPVQVAAWVRDNPDLEEEAKLFEESQISGRALSLIDRECLKDIGITSIGKQLLIIGYIKELLANDTKPKDSKTSTGSSVGQEATTKMKVKIISAHKQEMLAEEVHNYHSKCNKRHDILQWVSEKNRKISNGYDFEKSRTPAKRAYKPNISSDEDKNQSIAPTDAQIPSEKELSPLYIC